MENSQPCSLITFCKNHPDVPSRYFASEQPWVKYCHQCALNVALCGKNISQDLSNEEFQRKMQIFSCVNQLKRFIQQTDDNQTYYSKIMALLQEGAQPLSNRISELQHSIKELIATKDRLQQLYNKEIGGKISQYTQRQGKIALNCRQIKCELEQIQSNFSNLIAYDRQQFQEYIEKWNALAQKSKKQLISEQEFTEGKEKLLEVMESFYTEIDKLSSFSINTNIQNRRLHLPSDETFDMVLTPVDSNSLNTTVALDTAFKKGKRELKLRTVKRNQTERESVQNKKRCKRASFCGIQNRDLSYIYSK